MRKSVFPGPSVGRPTMPLQSAAALHTLLGYWLEQLCTLSA
jgi:hypothetical protein